MSYIANLNCFILNESRSNYLTKWASTLRGVFRIHPPREEVTLHALLVWRAFDPAERNMNLGLLFQSIRFAFLSEQSLHAVEELANINNNSHFNNNNNKNNNNTIIILRIMMIIIVIIK